MDNFPPWKIEYQKPLEEKNRRNMARLYEALTESHVSFIEAQHMFFTATAPESGRINLSPKGMDTFRVFNPHEVGYLDLTGSGNEAAAHLQHQARMTIMFCSFSEKPLILRLYGKGRILLPRDPDWPVYHPAFEPVPGMRHIVVLKVESVQTSCGFAVPYYTFQGHRQQLVEFAEKKGPDGMEAYRKEKNSMSLDGLPIKGYSE